ncbi:hypothetical protein SK128_025237, partial [Halocaridina rubra]
SFQSLPHPELLSTPSFSSFQIASSLFLLLYFICNCVQPLYHAGMPSASPYASFRTASSLLLLILDCFQPPVVIVRDVNCSRLEFIENLQFLSSLESS